MKKFVLNFLWINFEFQSYFLFSFSKGLSRKDEKNSEAEQTTEKFDSEAMRYLSFILIPLLIGGAIYSLLYTPHKSWKSWTIQSLVNAVYAFGFLFMLPQLFVNYRLKVLYLLNWVMIWLIEKSRFGTISTYLCLNLQLIFSL